MLRHRSVITILLVLLIATPASAVYWLNQASVWHFGLRDASDGSAVDSGTVTVYITKDGGTQATSTNTATSEGNGQWSVVLTASEMNAETIGLVAAESGSMSAYAQLSTIDPIDVRAAIGLSAANLDAQLTGIADDATTAADEATAVGVAVGNLNDFDPNTDPVASVTGLTTTTINNAIVAGTLGTNITAIKTVTDSLPNGGAFTTMQSNITTILGSTSTSIPGLIAVVAADAATGATNSTNILVDTNELQLDWTNAGRLDTILDSILTAVGTNIPDSIGNIPTVSEIRDDIDANSTQLAALVSKLPSASAKMAGEGVVAKNLDQVSGGGGGGSIASIDVYGPAILTVPREGTKLFRVRVLVHSSAGVLTDPDSNTINLTYSDPEGGSLPSGLPATATRVATGMYYFDMSIPSTTDTNQQIVVDVNALISTVAYDTAITLQTSAQPPVSITVGP